MQDRMVGMQSPTVVFGDSPVPSGGHWAIVAVAIAVGWLIVHVVFAAGVFADAGKRRTELAPAWAWALATLMTGVLGAVGYWVVHRSTLAPPPSPDRT